MQSIFLFIDTLPGIRVDRSPAFETAQSHSGQGSNVESRFTTLHLVCRIYWLRSSQKPAGLIKSRRILSFAIRLQCVWHLAAVGWFIG